jgi:hypothetical protein
MWDYLSYFWCSCNYFVVICTALLRRPQTGGVVDADTSISYSYIKYERISLYQIYDGRNDLTLKKWVSRRSISLSNIPLYQIWDLIAIIDGSYHRYEIISRIFHVSASATPSETAVCGLHVSVLQLLRRPQTTK